MQQLTLTGDERERELVADGGLRPAEELARKLISKSPDVESDDVTVSGGTVEVTVIEETFTIKPRGKPGEAANVAARHASRLQSEQYGLIEDQGGSDGE